VSLPFIVSSSVLGSGGVLAHSHLLARGLEALCLSRRDHAFQGVFNSRADALFIPAVAATGLLPSWCLRAYPGSSCAPFLCPSKWDPKNSKPPLYYRPLAVFWSMQFSVLFLLTPVADLFMAPVLVPGCNRTTKSRPVLLFKPLSGPSFQSYSFR